MQIDFGDSLGPTLSENRSGKNFPWEVENTPIYYVQFKNSFKFCILLYKSQVFLKKKITYNSSVTIQNSKLKKGNGLYDHWIHFDV